MRLGESKDPHLLFALYQGAAFSRAENAQKAIGF